MQRSGLGLAQFGDVPVQFGQAVKGYAVVQMMNVVITDVGREPCHDRICFQIAGRFKGGAFIGPALFIFEDDAGEIVLGIKEIGAKRAGNKEWKKPRQRQRQPSIMNGQPRDGGCMDQERGDGIHILPRRFKKRQNHHSENKHRDVAR